MYPNLGSGATQPSAPPYPSSTSTSTSSLPHSGVPTKPTGFTSLAPQSLAHNTPYPTVPPSSSYTGPYPPSALPPNASSYSPYSRPTTGQQFSPPPPQGGNPYQQTSYPPSTGAPQNQYPPTGYPQSFPGNQQPPSSGAPQNQYPPTGYPQSFPGNQQPPSSGAPQNQYPPTGYPQSFPGGQQPQQPPSSANTGYPNPYQSSNPYPPQQGNLGHQNPYQSSNPYPPQQGGYPQQQFNQNPSYPQQPQGGYSQYNQQQPYQNPNSYQPPGGGYNANIQGAPQNGGSDRLQALAGKFEISAVLAQRLNILQQFEIVVLCDDSGSMNTPVAGTNGTRWDELRAIVQIVMEIGTIFDSNGVDVHFLNRPPMLNVTDTRQVIESFSQRPQGLTPLTSALRRIFQSAASKPGSDKRLLVFVATDGAPTDDHGTVDIRSLENLMRNERQSNTTYVTFLACTDDDESVAYLSEWDRSMMNVDVVDDYKTEREEVRRNRGNNYPFSFGDYVVKALIGAVDPQMDALDESGSNKRNW